MDDAEPDLLVHKPTDDPSRARIALDLDARGEPIPAALYGKFCEHLRWNIYHGMEAQVLLNPVFGTWPFPVEDHVVDGGRWPEPHLDRIAEHVEALARDRGLPDADRLFEAYRFGAAFGWLPLGDSVTFSPDTGPTGERAQRIESGADGAGALQWTYLPLHRTRGFEFRVVARAAEPCSARLSIRRVDDEGTPRGILAEEPIELDRDWGTVEGELGIPVDADLDQDGLFAVGLDLPGGANAVVDRLLVYPDDHVNHADPEVVGFLRDADLPLLRWPGGNFVSDYHWRDGVGPVDERPVEPNPAWGGLEYHLFGTDEFAAFCDAVGCEPMICVNAGSGTPAEAAAWVEYCNGSTDTPMGALRAEHGHPEPYGIDHWEVGNEQFGEWQVRWTTPGGYVDRFERFRDAMTEADPSIEIHACGHRTRFESDWNETVIADARPESITDHVLTGGTVGPETDPAELYHAFVGFASQLGREYRDLRERMREAGIEDPRLAITELQLFADFEGDPDPGGEGLTPERMPTNESIAEALYDATIIHECVRLGGFVPLLTHSATVNHGGGLKKERERVWADPCHYGHALGIALAGKRPVRVELACDTISTAETFDEILPVDGVPSIDAMAAVSPDGSELTAMLVHRSADAGPIDLSIDPGSFDAADAEATVLSAEAFSEGNNREHPERVVPEAHDVDLADGRVALELPPYSLTRVTLRE